MLFRSSVVPILLNTNGTGSGNLSVQGYQNGGNPYQYRLQVVSYLMPDGTTVMLKDDAPYSDTIWIGDSDAADANVQFKTTGDASMVQSATLMTKIVAAPYTVAYVTNQTDVAADRSEGVIAIPAELPPLSKPGYVFLGWYMDNKTFADPAVPGAYITADLALSLIHI